MGHYVGHSETFDNTLDTPAYAAMNPADALNKFPPCAPECTPTETYLYFNMPEVAEIVGPYLHDYGTAIFVGALIPIVGGVIWGSMSFADWINKGNPKLCSRR